MSSELGVERPTTLSLSEAQGVERRVHFDEVERPRLVTARQHSTPSTSSPRKARPDPDFKPKRKRSMSFSSPGEHRFGNKWRPKRVRVLPSKFLLGGSITDPLNLGSLDKEAAQGTAETSTAVGGGAAISKRSAAVRVIIPPNINDPLNLDASSDNEDLHTDALQRQMRRRRRRKRKRRLSEPVDGHVGQEGEEVVGLEEVQEGGSSPSRPDQVTLKPLTINTDLVSPPGTTEGRRESSGGQPVTPTGTKPGGPSSAMQRPPFKKQRHKSDNKIVSPVIPQPGGERKRHPSHPRHHTERPHLSQQNLQPPRSYNPKSELFQFGNYNKYYGYRNPDQTPDVRLEYLKREWFDGREVLDIGCNIGHVTLTVARDFNPKRVVGIDIDKKLVNIAQKNIKHYLRKGDAEEANFPKSMRLLYGPLRPPVQADGFRSFPHNVKFVHGNYVLESDELLETVRPEFDLVLCLSITKWIHLNWGDAGLKRFFRRIFYNLRPGGRLVLEPQAWPSYNKRRKLTKRIFDNYKSICLFPDKFNDFLLHEVGFSTSEKLVTPNHTARGFQRPIIIYTKAGGSTKSSPVGESSTANTSVATTTTAATITTSVIGDDDVFSTEAIGHSKEPSQKKGEKRRRDSEKAEESPLIKEAQRQQQEQHKDSCPSRQPHTRVHNCDKAPIPCTSCPTSEKVVHVCDSSINDELVLRVVGDKTASYISTTTTLSSSHISIPSDSSITTTSTSSIITTGTTTVPTLSTNISVPNTTKHSFNTPSSASQEREGPASSGVASPKPTVTPDSNCSKPLAVEIGKKTNEDREEHRDSIKAERSTDLSTLSIPNTLNQHCGREGTLGQAKRKMPGCEDKEEATKRVRLGNT
ncbi:7SK snRNA methylphosphate capping enzyme-like isoform X2 [Portunus trituberculatus]|nr:7SK snRNA methylphosphate capping enzyme-like isoform X2 [Portunus trituberculatus]XP_045134671.1 7SK snRNA methylphosphate capping enzyme-like isoform X2 [Portunus trituberculatus]XP_045134672.1 7SK snRNA methylphosphate capping enzyme-like isoform X2 [Portunus trituberculatus]